MKHIVVFSGSGVSAESGLKTFRDADGLWEEYKIEDVCTPDAWRRNQNLVNQFYNARRKQVMETLPNPAHYALADLQSYFNVSIITQNIDDLHERAGSGNVLHLHGEIMKSRSSIDSSLIYSMNKSDICEGELCEKGSQLRPHVVWFGEAVPAMIPAAEIVSTADIFIVVGTSLQVYPAAGLASLCPSGIPYYLIDPNAHELSLPDSIQIISKKAGIGMPELVTILLEKQPNDQ